MEFKGFISMRERFSDAQKVESVVEGTEYLNPRFQEFTQLKSLCDRAVLGVIGLYCLVVLPVAL